MKKITKLLPIIGIIIFVYIIYSIGFDKIFSAFKNMNLKYLIPALIFLTIEIILLAYKWGIIIKLQGFKIKFKEVLKFYLMGNFYGFITPSRVGSLIRANYLKEKTERSLIECGSGIVIERVFDLLAILILSILGAIYVANHVTGLLTTLLLVLFGLVIAGIFFSSKRRARFAFKILYKVIVPNKFKDKARYSFYKFYDSIPSIRKLIYPFILTLLTWVIAGTFMYFVALMFQIKVPFLIFIILIPISIAVGMIPITMSGLGTREATIISLLKIFSVPAEATLSMSLASLILGAIIPALVGFLIILKK